MLTLPVRVVELVALLMVVFEAALELGVEFIAVEVGFKVTF